MRRITNWILKRPICSIRTTMKRKKQKILFFCRKKDRLRPFGADPESDSEADYTEFLNGPELNQLFKPNRKFDEVNPLPYEMLVKIFQEVIEHSNDPIRELVTMACTCERWRQIIVQTPSLWHNMNLSKLPLTDRNMTILSKILPDEENINRWVKAVSFSNQPAFKNTTSVAFIESLIAGSNVKSITINAFKPNVRMMSPTTLTRLVRRAKRLRLLALTSSRPLFNNQKWIVDHLIENGKELETLDLSMSLTTIPTQLMKAIGTDYCPKLTFLDLSTCEALTTHSFDAIQLAELAPNLQYLRVANVSFRRVHQAPDVKGFRRLKELSMPIGVRDADRDDALFGTLAYGSDEIERLDLRGSSISPNALLDMPSDRMKALHIDDLCPIGRKRYHEVIERWSESLEKLSLIKINCPETIKNCLNALVKSRKSIILELDLSGSDVATEDLAKFLKFAKSLEKLTLSCRSLPRGCKGEYQNNPKDKSVQDLKVLKKKLK